jgi:hypothetical protein
MRNFTLTTRRKDGTKGRIVLQAESFKEAIDLAGNPVVVYSKSEPLKEPERLVMRSCLKPKVEQCLNCKHSKPKQYMALDCSQISSVVEYDYLCPHWKSKYA